MAKAKKDKQNETIADNQKDAELVPGQEGAGIGNENETQAVQTDITETAGENAGDGQEQGEGAKLDSENETATVGAQGDNLKSEVKEPEAKNTGGEKKQEKVEKTDAETKAKTPNAKTVVPVKLIEPDAKTAKRNKIAGEVFAQKPNTDVLHFTSDLIPFFDKNDAIKHSTKLNDKTIVTINKEK